MRHLQDRDVPLLMNRTNLAPNAHTTTWIERAEWLVEQENRWSSSEGAGDCDELTLSAGEPANRASEQVFRPEPRCGLTGDLSGRRAVGDVLVDTQVREEISVLVDESDPSRFGWKTACVPAVEIDRARAQRPYTRDRLEQRGLSGPGGPDDDTVLSARHRERHVAELERSQSRADTPNLDHPSPAHPVSAAVRP